MKVLKKLKIWAGRRIVYVNLFLISIVALVLFGITTTNETLKSNVLGIFTINIKPTPTVTPTPTPIKYVQWEAAPTVEPRKPYVDPDPIEPCTSKNSGDSVKVRRSECQNKYVDCQINDTWRVLTKDECTKNQKAQAPVRNSSTALINCVIKGVTYRLTQADCDWNKNYVAGIDADMKAYEQTNNQIMQTWQNQVNSYPTYSPTQIDTSIPQPTYSTIQPIPSPKDCYEIGSSGQFICK